MKILHVGKYYSPFEGGIENFLSSFLTCSAGLGVEHLVIAHHHRLWQKSVYEKLPETGLFRSATICKLLFAPISPFFYLHLKSRIRTFNPDLIHVHMPNLSAFWLLLPGVSGNRPIIVHWHADVVPSRKNILLSLAYVFYRVLERKLLAKACTVIATSEPYLNTSKPLQEWRNKCHVVPLGLARKPVNAMAKGTTLWKHPDKFKLLCIGRLTYYKGQEFLLQAIAGLTGVELILVGTGKYLHRYQSLLERLGLRERATLFGHATATEIESLLQSCDCLCLPSIERTEAFGLVLLEAMQQGKPCICTDIEGSGMSWVVQHGATGLVVRSGDSQALRLAIIQLAENRTLAEDMGRKGFERYASHFDMETVTKKILALYNDCVASGNPVITPPAN